MLLVGIYYFNDIVAHKFKHHVYRRYGPLGKHGEDKLGEREMKRNGRGRERYG